MHGDSRYQIHNNPSGLILLTPISNSLGNTNGHLFFFFFFFFFFFWGGGGGGGVYPSVRPKKKKLYWRNPTYPKNAPYPRSYYFFLLRNFRKKLRNCHKKL